MSCKSY